MWSQFTISWLLTCRLLKRLRLGPKCLRLLITWFSRVESQTAPAHSWSIDFSSSEATLIPWLVPKKGFDCLIQIWSRSQTLLHGIYKWLPLDSSDCFLQFSVSYSDMCEQFLCVSIFLNYLQYSLFSQRWHVVLPPESLFPGFTNRLLRSRQQQWRNRAKLCKSFIWWAYTNVGCLFGPPYRLYSPSFLSSLPSYPFLLPLLPPLLHLPPPVNGWAVEDASPLQDHDWWAARRHDGRYRETSHDKHLPKVWHQTTHH